MGVLDSLPTLADDPRRARQKCEEPSRHDVKAKQKADAESHERLWNAEIDRRDRRTCRACHKPSDPDRVGLLVRGHRAHIIYASAQGSWEPWNRVTLCARCHNDEHKDRLRFTADGGPYVGIDANGPMEFWRKDATGAWYLSAREVALGIWEKD